MTEHKNCAICEKLGKVVYEDKDIIAILLNKGIKDGHIAVSPKKHSNIISQVPDEIIARMYLISKKLAMSFSELGTESFNMIADNHADETFHFALNLIPRSEGDKLNLQWDPKQMEAAQLEQVFTALKNMPLNPIVFAKEEPKQEKKQVMEEKPEEENYMLNQLKRVP